MEAEDGGGRALGYLFARIGQVLEPPLRVRPSHQLSEVTAQLDSVLGDTVATAEETERFLINPQEFTADAAQQLQAKAQLVAVRLCGVLTSVQGHVATSFPS